MYIDLQGSKITKLHRRDPNGDYSWILDIIPSTDNPANVEPHKGDGKYTSYFFFNFSCYVV